MSLSTISASKAKWPISGFLVLCVRKIGLSCRGRYRLWRDERHLDGQPAYLLKDIGLTHADIHRALRDRFPR